MHHTWLLMCILTAIVVVGCGTAFAVRTRGHVPRVPRRAILLVAFGTSIPEAQKAFDQVHEQTRKAFPEIEIRWAFTSRVVRAKLAGRGRDLDSPETALARMMDEGYTHVAILSLHVIPGEEFHDLRRNAGLFAQMAGGFQEIRVGKPLLSSREDMVRVARAMMKALPPRRKTEEGVLFIGHGNERHPADAIYSAMHSVFQEMDPNVFVGTVSGYPSPNDLLPKLGEKSIQKIYLVPLMAIAGDHARKDMAGEAPDSWKSILSQNGIASEALLTGMAEHPEIVEIWLDHLREAFEGLDTASTRPGKSSE